MIFSGDFVFPGSFSKNIFARLGEEFRAKPKIINFESTIKEINKKKTTQGIALYSSIDSVKALKELNVTCTSHANNHVTDFNYNIKQYKSFFTSNHITPIGLGETVSEASKPFLNHAEKIVILSFGWETIRCKAARKNTMGVNPYRYKWTEGQVRKYQKSFPEYRIVLFIHWNYEFETYPLPADRQFAHYLIDIGVDSIFGHHPHVINGYEIYKNKPIFYSLGNFYFPQVKYGKHQLTFRQSALEGISVDYNGNIDDLRIYYHVQQKETDSIHLKGKFKLGEFELLEQLSTFKNLSHQQYIKFYKKNRFHKNKLLPVFKSFTNPYLTEAMNSFVKLRQFPIDILTRIKGK